MKPLNWPRSFPKVIAFIALMVLVGQAQPTFAQLADCTSGTVMYGVFSPVSTSPPVGSDSTEIRPIDFATGAIGGLMGGRRYRIVKTLSGNTYYGSSALALSSVNNIFYAFTQMGVSGQKDIIAINTTLPTPTMTTIGSTSTSGANDLDDYHIVKAAISPNGWGYAIGVNRKSGDPASTYNPLIRFRVCTTAGCATSGGFTIAIMGYLPDTGIMSKMELYNGDIAFDNSGNLYFLSSAYKSALGKYTDARLFKINAADIPASPGSGTIPMSFVADFNSLDSTGCSGIAMDPAGNMYFSLRRYQDNNPSTGVYTTELYRSYDTATADLMPGFAPMPAGMSVGDLASCYMPASILAINEIALSGRNVGGRISLNWQVSNNTQVNYYEVQRSTNGSDYQTIASISAEGANPEARYSINDDYKGQATVLYYRVRQVMKNGLMRYYSNVVKIGFSSKMTLRSQVAPNPFIDHIECAVNLQNNATIVVNIKDQNGRLIKSESRAGTSGENALTLNNLGALRPGIYILEVNSGNETIREKLIKQ